LSNPIEASKGDGEMSGRSMGVMSEKFGSAISAYSYLIFVLLYVPCVSVMGAIARESSRGWMTLSIVWGINVAYSMATLFYQAATFAAHPITSILCFAIVIMVNVLFVLGLYLMRNRFAIGLSDSGKKSCCVTTPGGSCH